MALCPLFVVWYASGLVMTYAQMPALGADERLARRPALDASRVLLTPAEAVARAGHDGPVELRLTSLFGRPVYRVGSPDLVTVFADDGRVAQRFDLDEAKASLASYLEPPTAAWRLDATLGEPDQWTLAGEYGSLRPLYRVRVDDAAGTVLYLSAVTGDVVLVTTRGSRAAAWAGAIPHWLYLTSFRRHAQLWRWSIVALAAVGMTAVGLGLVLGLRQWRSGGAAAYRSAMRWHLWLGTLFGLTTLVFVGSGMMTLDPLPLGSGGPTVAQRSAFRGGPMLWEAFRASAVELARAAGGGVKQIEFSQLDGQPRYRLQRSPREVLVLDGSGRRADPLGEAVLVAAARRAMPGAGVREIARLSGYDAYYSERGPRRPLPVLRLKFDDPASTWLYLDPATGEIAASVDRGARVERWVSDALHRLDLPFLPRDPWRRALVSLLCAGGVALSLTAVALTARRLRPR
jgi:hypothetical protein